MPVRRSALFLALALGSAAGYVAVARAVAAGPLSVDRAVLSWVVEHRSAQGDLVFVKISNVGAPVVMAALAVAAALVLWWRKRPGDGVVLLGAEAAARIAAELLKTFHGRPRPPIGTALVLETDPALPSAHAMESIVVLGLLGFLVSRTPASRPLRVTVVVATVCTVAAIGASRLYLGVHWLSDVVAGWLLGGACVASCVAVLSRTLSRSERPDEVGRTANVRVPAARSPQDAGRTDLLGPVTSRRAR